MLRCPSAFMAAVPRPSKALSLHPWVPSRCLVRCSTNSLPCSPRSRTVSAALRYLGNASANERFSTIAAASWQLERAYRLTQQRWRACRGRVTHSEVQSELCHPPVLLACRVGLRPGPLPTHLRERRAGLVPLARPRALAVDRRKPRPAPLHQVPGAAHSSILWASQHFCPRVHCTILSLEGLLLWI